MTTGKISIKMMIILNGILILAIAGGATIFNVLTTTFIQKKLTRLTSQSTPFQVKTIQAQAKLQEANGILVKMASASSLPELQGGKTRFSAVVQEMKQISADLTSLSLGDNKVETVVGEFERTSDQVYAVTKEKLDSEATAKEASARMSSKLQEIGNKLQGIDVKIKTLQKGASERLSTSSGIVVKASDRVRDLYELSKTMRSAEIAFDEIRRADSKRGLDQAKGKFSLAVSKALAADFFKARDKEIKKLHDRINELQNRVLGKEELAGVIEGYLAKPEPDRLKKKESLEKEISRKMFNASSAISNYMDVLLDDIGSGNQNLKQSVDTSSLSSNVLLLSSRLIAIGHTIEADAAKLLLMRNSADLAAQSNIIAARFNEVDVTIRKLSAIFVSLGRKDDVAFLGSISRFFHDVKETLIGQQGLAKKIDKTLQAQQNALSLSRQIESTVADQQQKSKAGLSLASDEQEKAIQAVSRVVRTSITASLMMGVAAIVIGVGAGLMGARTIGRSIAEITEVADAIAKGDLSREIKVSGAREIRSVGESFSKMRGDLKEMIGKVISSAGKVSGNAHHLQAAADALSQGMQDQAGHTEAAASSIEEISQTIAEVAANAEKAAQESRNASAIADDGRKAVELTEQEMQRILGTFEHLAQTVEALGQSSTEIGEIVSVITDIADQTNLLALNAAIEAARAGESGRGFSVVADEVKKLAERTAEATGQIAGMIQGIRKDIGSSVHTVGEGKSLIQKGVQQAGESKLILERIVNVSNSSTDFVCQIASAATELTAAANGISSNMDDVYRVAKGSVSSAQSIDDASKELNRLAAQLKELVAWFKMERAA